jgi:DNA gyrase/topoisomerase IV subunit B
MSKRYDAKDVRVLDEVSHIRLNPSMYIGDISNPVHLIEEALDNALDEALAGYANIIAVNIDTKNDVFAVLDNGRGIPIDGDTPVTVSSKLFSGAKFQDSKTAYEISSGLHGVGLVAVNALSEFYNVEVYRDNKHGIYKFIDTKLRSKSVKPNGNAPFSTKIEFKPSSKIFESTKPDIDRIRRRLYTASAEMKNVTFALNIDDEVEVIKLTIEEHFANSCLSSEDEVEVLRMDVEKKPESFSVMFAYEDKGPNSSRILSSVNLLPVDGGGTHVIAFTDMLKDFFTARAKKNGYKFQPNDCLIGLRAYLMLSLKEPKFAGQTKEKLTNHKSEFDKFTRSIRGSLEAYANDNSEEIDLYLQRFHDYRSKLDSKKLVKTSTGGRRASTQFTKLRDCRSRDGELFIVEGDSAGGSIIHARNSAIHAVLPLKGKSIPNAITTKNILKNKEVEELIRALGTGVGPHFDIENMRYGKIICATDADHDGAHIACLLTMALATLTPEIIRAGKYYIAQTPLFAINDGKVFKPLWDEKELEKARKANKRISRFKGLGELTPQQMKVCLLDEKTRNLIPVEFSDDIEQLSRLFSNVECKRELLENGKSS